MVCEMKCFQTARAWHRTDATLTWRNISPFYSQSSFFVCDYFSVNSVLFFQCHGKCHREIGNKCSICSYCFNKLKFICPELRAFYWGAVAVTHLNVRWQYSLTEQAQNISDYCVTFDT